MWCNFSRQNTLTFIEKRGLSLKVSLEVVVIRVGCLRWMLVYVVRGGCHWSWLSMVVFAKVVVKVVVGVGRAKMVVGLYHQSCLCGVGRQSYCRRWLLESELVTWKRSLKYVARVALCEGGHRSISTRVACAKVIIKVRHRSCYWRQLTKPGVGRRNWPMRKWSSEYVARVALYEGGYWSW